MCGTNHIPWTTAYSPSPFTALFESFISTGRLLPNSVRAPALTDPSSGSESCALRTVCIADLHANYIILHWVDISVWEMCVVSTELAPVNCLCQQTAFASWISSAGQHAKKFAELPTFPPIIVSPSPIIQCQSDSNSFLTFLPIFAPSILPFHQEIFFGLSLFKL